MTPSAHLIALHERLVSDPSNAFSVIGTNRMSATPAGRAWLHDYAAYKDLWRSMERDQLDPEAILADHFGFVSAEEGDEPVNIPKPKRPTKRFWKLLATG